MTTLSIIVPTRNEEQNINLLLESIFSVKRLADVNFEVIFSDGASQDNTCDCVKRWMQQDRRISLIESEENQGLSAAVIAGARKASGKYVLVMDADLSHPTEKIPELLEPLLLQQADMVIGSRYQKGGRTPDWPFTRKFASKLATLPARLLTDIKDPLAGFFAVSRERLARITNDVCGFKIGLELLATSENIKVKEIPITFRDRQYGYSKMGLEVILDYLHQLLILSGIRLSHSLKPLHLMGLLAFGWGLDILLYVLMTQWGVVSAVSHQISFLVASVVTMSLGVFGKGELADPANFSRMRQKFLAFCYGLFLLLILRIPLFNLLGGAELSSLALMALSTITLTLSYLGYTVYVCSIGQKRIRGELVLRYYLLGYVVYLLLLKLFNGSIVPLIGEEEYFIGGLVNSSHQAGSLVDHIVLSLTQIMSYFSLGVERGLRYLNVVLSILSAIFIFNFTRDLFDRSAAFKSLLMFSVLPFFFGAGFWVSRDSMLVFLWAVSIYLLYRLLVVGSPRIWFAAAVVLALLVCYDLFGLALLAGTVGYVFYHVKEEQWLKRRKIIAFAFTFLGVVITDYIFRTGPGSGGYGGQVWFDTIINGDLSHRLISILLLLTPVTLLTGLGCCYKMDHETWPAESRYKGRDNRRFIQLFFLLPLLTGLTAGWILQDVRYVSGVVWLAIIPCMAQAFSSAKGEGSMAKRFVYRFWWATVMVLVPLFGVMFIKLSG